MASPIKAAKKLARQLSRLSVVDGAVSPERVSGVLQYLEKHQPARTLAVLRAYHRMIERELARSQAVVEHSGPLSPEALQAITAALSKRYQRPVTAVSRPNPDLLAGLRVHLADDVYESSVSGHLSELAAAV